MIKFSYTIIYYNDEMIKWLNFHDEIKLYYNDEMIKWLNFHV